MVKYFNTADFFVNLSQSYFDILNWSGNDRYSNSYSRRHQLDRKITENAILKTVNIYSISTSVLEPNKNLASNQIPDTKSKIKRKLF